MKKIAIIGPESVGKTQLCRELAQHFDAIYEPELARIYVEKLNRPYTYQDVENIAQLQIEQEEKYNNKSHQQPFVFFDTDLIVTKVWFAHKYGIVPHFVEKRLREKKIDLYLLCQPDLPWVYDPVRENKENRELLFDKYQKEIEQLGTDFFIIKGVGKERTQNAITYLNTFFNKK